MTQNQWKTGKVFICTQKQWKTGKVFICTVSLALGLK